MSLSRRLYFVPVLALLTIPAWGDVLYSDGAVNGMISGYNITGLLVSDSFVIASDSTVTDLSNIGLWINSGDTFSVLDWTISTAADGGGTILGSATAIAPDTSTQLTPASSFGDGGIYDVYNVSFSVPSIFLSAGTYYLTLQNAHAVSSPAVFWDESDGPSTADLNGSPVPSQSFEIDGTSAAPEPASLLLLGAGLVGLGAMRKFRSRT